MFVRSRRIFSTSRQKRRTLCSNLVAISIFALLVFARPENGRVPAAERARSGMVSVCVTGQLCRLELRSKLWNFFRPILREQDIFATFILSNACHFTNSQPTLYEDQTLSFQTIQKKLARWGIMQKDLPGRFEAYVRMVPDYEPFLQQRYVDSLDKKEVVGMNATRRALNHWTQWSHLRTCWSSFPTLVKETSVYFVRFREDLIFLKQFMPPTPLPRQVLTPECLSWRGSNDKFALVSRESAYSYFVGVHMVYRDYFNTTNCSHVANCDYMIRPSNPETYLYQALKFLGVNVSTISVPAASLHVIGTLACAENVHRQLGARNPCISDQPELLKHNNIEYRCFQFLHEAFSGNDLG